ncbi:MAG: DUF2889 domain-containing protein [Alphaproteobacteria bacterium]|nr:DUF2889 domain-containing protein [Alphaproteobacteria bacterium]
MPLSESVDREPMHHRTVDCHGYHRADGLWDIEGRVRDVKAYDFRNEHRGILRAGDAVHDMWIRVTVDDDLQIIDAEAATDDHPFPTCPAITPAFRKLIGLRIGPGWMGEVRRRLGGTQGCTHLVELLGPIATTTYQTIFPARDRKERANPNRTKPGHLDTCHALASDGPVVKQHWPEFYTGS